MVVHFNGIYEYFSVGRLYFLINRSNGIQEMQPVEWKWMNGADFSSEASLVTRIPFVRFTSAAKYGKTKSVHVIPHFVERVR